MGFKNNFFSVLTTLVSTQGAIASEFSIQTKISVNYSTPTHHGEILHKDFSCKFVNDDLFDCYFEHDERPFEVDEVPDEIYKIIQDELYENNEMSSASWCEYGEE